MSGYKYKGIDLSNIVYGYTTINNTQGYNSFPGVTESTPTNLSIQSLVNSTSSISDNLYGYNYFTNIHMLTNRTAGYIEYNTTTNAVNVPTGVNYLRVLMIGATGGGGGGGGSLQTSTFDASGGGGGSGGKTVLGCFKINSTVFNTYSITIGTGGIGGGGGSKATPGTSGANGTAGGITSLISGNNVNPFAITINGSGGGNGGINGTNGTGGANTQDGLGALGTEGTSGLPSYNGNASNVNTVSQSSSAAYNTLNQTTTNYHQSTGGVMNTTLGEMLTSAYINIVPVNYTFNSLTSCGGAGCAQTGNAATNTTNNRGNSAPGQNGSNGYVRVYYFYN
uniref:Glycine-rich domain-containing protein n=1 Tax=viral metagenome TaxID=1070528 RepID=A0A6C0ET99_9ZZZZ